LCPVWTTGTRLIHEGTVTLVFCLGYSGCNGTEPDTVTIEPIDLEFEEPPINLPGIDVSFAKDVPYGPYERNVFDIFLVDSEEPTPSSSSSTAGASAVAVRLCHT